MANKKVRVAIIGVGNCASSLVQGLQFYKIHLMMRPSLDSCTSTWVVITSMDIELQ